MKNLLIISILFNAYLFGQVPTDCYSSHITKIDDFYTNNTDFSDLEFLKKELQNKKIIVLGESGHGDGASFEAKTRLVKRSEERRVGKECRYGSTQYHK